LDYKVVAGFAVDLIEIFVRVHSFIKTIFLIKEDHVVLVELQSVL
jgi:hypothetical protein